MRHMKKYLPSVLVFFALLAIWELVVRLMDIPKFILPAPSRIAQALYSSASLLWEHSLVTVAEALAGFLLAVLIGVGLAVLISLAPSVKRLVYPILVVSQTIPIIAIAPLLFIWLDYGLAPKIAVVALVCFFPVTLSLAEGLEATDQDMVRLLLAMGAHPWQIFWKVRLPGALPSFLAGLKISATYSIMGAVIGEWLGASRGLGVYMTRSMHSFLTERVFAAIVVISALSLLLFALIALTGWVMMPWRHYRADK